MKNKYLTRFLCITLVSAMIAAVPFTTLAGEYEEWLVTAQDWTDSLVAEDGADPDDWMDDDEYDPVLAEMEEESEIPEDLIQDSKTTPTPEPTTEPSEEKVDEQVSETPAPSKAPESQTSESDPENASDHSQTGSETPGTTEDPEEEDGDLLFDETGDPSRGGILFPYEEEPKEDPAEARARQTATPTVTPTGTPTPTPTATPTPSPMPTPAVRIGLTTSMVSNLHAGKEFYLASLSTTYGLSFSENFPQIMDQIESEYLAKNHLKRSDSAGLLSRDWQDVIAIYIYEQSKLGRKVFNLGSSDKKELARIFAYLNPIMQTGPDAGDDASKWDYSKEHYYDPKAEEENRKKSGTTSGSGTDLFSGSENEAEPNLENKQTDALWWQVPVEDPDGILNEIVLESAVDPSLYMEDLEEVVEPANLTSIFDSGVSDSGRIAQFGNKPVAYANRHINYYIRDNNISRSDRSILKKYTETDCKLLCATVTAAKGFVRQSVGDNVSEERVDVISAAYSLVGKVGYFWGGKSTYLGEDPSWGSVGTVTASGSNSTGTLRAYGLDCSGFVTWAVINGYEDKAMQSAIGDGTSEQWEHAKVVAEADAQPGDLVFQRGPEAGSDNHVGILVGKTDSGDWIAVHCSSSQNGVTVGEAYSASFRYIREPSFYPEKVEPTNIVLEENIDDILVEADLPGGTSSTSDFSLFEDDSLDVVIVDGNDASDADGSTLAGGNMELFEPYDPAEDTEGLVVLDETGPELPVILDETQPGETPENTENTGTEANVEPAGPVLLITDGTEETPQDTTQESESVIVIYPEEAGPLPQITPEIEPEAAPEAGAEQTQEIEPESTPETGAEQTPETDPENTPEAGSESLPEFGPEFISGTAPVDDQPVVVIDGEDGGAIAAIDVDTTMEETDAWTSSEEASTQVPAGSAEDTAEPMNETPGTPTAEGDLQTAETTDPAEEAGEEEQPQIESIDVDAALASEEDVQDAQTVPEEVMELVVLEGFDWDDFSADAQEEEEEPAAAKGEEQGPVFLPEAEVQQNVNTVPVQEAPVASSDEVIVIDPDLFGDSTPTPPIPVLEVFPSEEAAPADMTAVFGSNSGETPEGNAPVMEVFDKSTGQEEGIVLVDPSAEGFSGEYLFSSQERPGQTAMHPGEIVVEQELIRLGGASVTTVPTQAPASKSFFSLIAGLFQ